MMLSHEINASLDAALSTPRFDSLEYKRSCRGKGKPLRPQHYYLLRDVKVRLRFLKGNSLELPEGATKKLQAARSRDGKIYLTSSEGWRELYKYADKVGAEVV